MAKYRILSMDGGGIRGVITAVILERLAAEHGLNGWLDRANLLAGTSTGGILATAIAFGLHPSVIRKLYEDKGEEIFDDSWLDDLKDMGQLFGAQYDSKNLERILKATLGSTTLGQLHRTVLVTTFDLDNENNDATKRTWKPKIFHNVPGTDADNDILAYKAALCTSVAPTYFPSVDGYVDGGVYANNPSMCALAQTQDSRNTTQPKLTEVALLSLGTGTSLVYIAGKSHDWGFAQWAEPIINLMLDGVGGIADYQCKQMLGTRYHRLAPAFPPGRTYPMDDVKHIKDMVTFARNVDLAPTIQWLQKNW